ncbi:hypothetical protein AAC978_03570 [Desulfitobacterium sp. THU1]|uniref:hypothetical protein n=1 Tax=Desulfitobacterium sp. THU1 TaxID=3138072 RepID=UPI003120112E
MIYSRERLLSEQLPVLREKHTAESGWKQDVSNRLRGMSRFSRRPDGAKCLSIRTGARSLQSERVKQNPGDFSGAIALSQSQQKKRGWQTALKAACHPP